MSKKANKPDDFAPFAKIAMRAVTVAAGANAIIDSAKTNKKALVPKKSIVSKATMSLPKWHAEAIWAVLEYIALNANNGWRINAIAEERGAGLWDIENVRMFLGPDAEDWEGAYDRLKGALTLLKKLGLIARLPRATVIPEYDRAWYFRTTVQASMQ